MSRVTHATRLILRKCLHVCLMEKLSEHAGYQFHQGMVKGCGKEGFYSSQTLQQVSLLTGNLYIFKLPCTWHGIFLYFGPVLK